MTATLTPVTAATAGEPLMPHGYGVMLAQSQYEVHAARLAKVARRWWDGDDEVINDLLWTGLGVFNTVERLDVLVRVGGMVEREREVANLSDDDWERLRQLVGVEYRNHPFDDARQIALDECIADTDRECWAVVREVAAARAVIS